jgi:hypothetical protein
MPRKESEFNSEVQPVPARKSWVAPVIDVIAMDETETPFVGEGGDAGIYS